MKMWEPPTFNPPFVSLSPCRKVKGIYPNVHILVKCWSVLENYHINAGFRLACRSPLCRYVTWSPLTVSWLQLSVAMPLWLITERHHSQVELNPLYAICHGRQSGKVIDLLARRCLPLGHPSAASGTCAVVQISSSCGNVTSGKLVRKQH